MKNALFAFLLVGLLSCHETPVELTGTWETGCETFAKTSTGYVFSACCGSMDFPNLTLKAGQAITMTAPFVDINNQITHKTVRLIASTDAETIFLTFHTGLDVVQHTLIKNYNGPYCGCGCE